MTRPRPRMAAALAAGVAAVGLTACGIPTASSPSPIDRSHVPYHLLDPPTTTTTRPGSPPLVGVPELIYLVAPSQHLVAVAREVAVPATLTQIVGALLSGPTATESASGIQTFLNRVGVRVTLSPSGGVANVDFSSDPIVVVGPDQTLAIAQVVYTLTQQPRVSRVTFSIAGKAIEVPTAAGAQVPGPVGRSDYAALAPLA